MRKARAYAEHTIYAMLRDTFEINGCTHLQVDGCMGLPNYRNGIERRIFVGGPSVEGEGTDGWLGGYMAGWQAGWRDICVYQMMDM